MKTQSIHHTAFPDRPTVYYQFGMPKPEVADLTEPMKQKAKELADKLRRLKR